MGGGDLNLKKSWHPSTLKNIERVWKAEQKHDAEQKKIEQLQRELAEERVRQEMRQFAEDSGVLRKREEKLDWMYQGPTSLLNREDYLTGRPVDKAFDLLQQNEKEVIKNDVDSIPESIFSTSSKTVTVDLVNKIREDPLFFIRKQEDENKKQLLNNPVRMKQLQLLLRQSMGEKIKKTKKHKHRDSKKSKKDKKTHRHERRRRTSSSSDSEERHRQRKRKSQHEETSSKHRRNSSGLSSSDEPDSRNFQHSKKTQRNQPEPSWRKHANVTRQKASDSRDWTSGSSRSKKTLSAEDLEKKRQEMLDNAKWRDQQRTKNIKKYVKEEEKELEELNKGTSAESFIRPMLAKTVNNITVESRIKSNIYNIQRSDGAMERNFARR